VPICLSPHDSVAPLSASGGLAVLRPHTHPLLLSSVAVHYPLRILIAEDNSINQRLISKMLSRLGFHTHQFRLTADGQSAAEEIQRANVRLPALLVVAASSASPEQLLPVPGVASSMPATSAASSVSGDRPSSATSLNIDSLSPAPLSGNSDSSADGLSTSPHVNSRSKQPLSASMLATSSAALVPATACPAAVVSTPATLLLPSVHVSPLHDSVAVAVVPVVSLPSTLVSSTCYDMILMDLQMPYVCA
jgi:CheY-like chemotaxis protein